MENTKIVETIDNLSNEITQHIIIDRGNDEFTSMLKSVYDAQVEHLTEIPTPDEA